GADDLCFFQHTDFSFSTHVHVTIDISVPGGTFFVPLVQYTAIAHCDCTVFPKIMQGLVV
ncbi:hypothetical protein, partial [Megasphaera elsdenii]|uniref:hypothetical protein n=1 Tax=Megasphaera elsdenii TaxID=907 RepID=UPI003CFD1DD7